MSVGQCVYGLTFLSLLRWDVNMLLMETQQFWQEKPSRWKELLLWRSCRKCRVELLLLHRHSSSRFCIGCVSVPFFLHQGPSLTEYETSLNSMLTAGLRGNEENLWASVRLLSTFFRCPCSSGVCWLPAGRLLTTSSIQTHTVRGSNIKSGGPLVFWGLDQRPLMSWAFLSSGLKQLSSQSLQRSLTLNHL